MNPNHKSTIAGMSDINHAICRANHCADRLSDALLLAHWCDDSRNYHLGEAHKIVAELAGYMGYRLEKIDAESEAA